MLSCVDVAGRRLWLTMRGDTSGVSTYEVVATAAVQLSLVLSVSIEEFYGPNIIQNIATLLQVRLPHTVTCS